MSDGFRPGVVEALLHGTEGNYGDLMNRVAAMIAVGCPAILLAERDRGCLAR